MRAGDNVDILPRQRTKRAPYRSRNAYLLADYGDDRNRRIECDVLRFFVREIMRKFVAQRLDRAFRHGGRDNEADIVLRR